MTAQTDTVDPDRALKTKHRAMWALGDYPSVATEIIPELGHILVEAAGVGPGARVLDVAAGSGNAAIPAALAGARVVASDLTPELLNVGRAAAALHGAALAWEEGDAEALPYTDDAFDIVISCVGAMFAPHHQTTADEMLRVTRPGGTIGLLSWTPGGFIGQMFATMKPFVPPAPTGAQSPPLWGDEDHVRSLLGDRVHDFRARRGTLTVDQFDGPEHFRDYFKARYGPMIAAYRGLAHDAERTAELDRQLAELVRRFDRGHASTVMDWEYLLVTARSQ
ncbi:class I SAM-dependent methyltransferase [Pengzhenrongella phosphoraccumulans]|uniref:class I SAM-dependent methyltransferase n=1 Tax=Pengzhenrongella phosphoraccumulans TaxID=3114394 RepID=UPI003890D49A